MKLLSNFMGYFSSGGGGGKEGGVRHYHRNRR